MNEEWNNGKYGLPNKLNELFEDFFNKVSVFNALCIATQSMVRMIIYQECEQVYRQLSIKFFEHFSNERKYFELELSKELIPPLIKGIKITRSWIVDNTDFNNIMKEIDEMKRFDRLIYDINRRIKDSNIQIMIKYIQSKKEELINLNLKIRSELGKL